MNDAQKIEKIKQDLAEYVPVIDTWPIRKLREVIDTIDALRRERDESVAGAYLAVTEKLNDIAWDSGLCVDPDLDVIADEVATMLPADAQAALAARDVIVHKQGFDAGYEGAERAAFERERKYVAEKDATIARLQAELAAAKRGTLKLFLQEYHEAKAEGCDSANAIECAIEGVNEAIDAAEGVAAAMSPCIGNDPFCPCQDGDMCHYKGENPWPIREKIAMTDASKPLSARDFARYISDLVEEKGDYWIDAIEKELPARDAALIREAQAEAVERAKRLVISAGLRSDVWNVEWLAGQISALSPDPNYRQRIEAQARLDMYYALIRLPQRSHEGPCSPESGCDAACIDIAHFDQCISGLWEIVGKERRYAFEVAESERLKPAEDAK